MVTRKKRSKDRLKWENLGSIPVPKKEPVARQAIYPFDLMDVGNCIEINRSANTVRRAITKYMHSPTAPVGVKFAVRVQTKQTCRIWRTA